MKQFLRDNWDWIKKATRRWANVAMFVITITSTMNAIRLAYFNAELYMSYQTTSGPYEVIFDKDGHPSAGSLVSTVKPGQAYGWNVDYCLEGYVSATVHLQLMRLAQDGSAEQMYDERFVDYTPESHRCGPIFASWSVPMGAPTGSYEVRRTVIFRKGSRFELHRPLTTIRLQVSVISVPPVPDAIHSVYRIPAIWYK